MNILKQQILDEIRIHSVVFKKVSSNQYRIRCPICGDSKKNPNDAHCYIKCSDDPDEPLLYHCFLCQGKNGGIVDRKFLHLLGIQDNIFKELDRQQYNRIPSVRKSELKVILGDPIMESPQVKYINNRLGDGFTYDDFAKFKILWNIENIKQFVKSKAVLNTLPSNYDSISFLSTDKTMLLSRTFLDDASHSQWRKIKIDRSDRSFYTIASTVDLFTNNMITIHITEGIFDILSAYKNFNTSSNSLFIAALGQDYCSALEYMISLGFIGTNVMIKIFMDNGIDVKSLKHKLKKYKWLYHSIYLYRNVLDKDIGVRIENIRLDEEKI